MRSILVILCGISIGCTSIPTQHGTARFWGDYPRIKFDDGSVHFSADRANHSAVARVHWHGASNIAGQLVAGAIGLTGHEVAGAAATMIPPVVNRPTTRATPAP